MKTNNSYSYVYSIYLDSISYYLWGIAGKDRKCGSFYAFGWWLICPLIGIVYVALSSKKKTMSEAMNELNVMYKNGMIDIVLYNTIKDDILDGKIYDLKHYTSSHVADQTFIVRAIIGVVIMFSIFKSCNG